MIYKVYCDGYLLYHTGVESMNIFSPSLELELNKTGSFKFTVHADHPYYGLIKRMKSIITVYRDERLLFRGRVLDEVTGWHNEKKCSCESDTAFLLDSILRPFSYSGTAAEFLAYVLTLHNAQVDANKRIQPGNVTVEGLVSYVAEEYLTTHETLQKALFEPMGGYLQTRFKDGVAYLDYLADITLLSPQTIEFGKNLLDLQRTRKGADIATVIIPLGAKVKDEEGNDTGQRLTIESVNDGLDFVQDENGVAQFGQIVKSVIFDDVADPETLKQRGQAQLADSVKALDTIELTAADLSAAGYDIESFNLGTQVRVVSKPHGIDQRFIVVKLSVNPFKPAGNKLVLGGTIKTFTQQTSTSILVAPKDGKDGQDAVTLRIDSSRGTVFKNNEVSTVLQAVIFKGGKTITDAAAMRTEFGTAAHLEWQWQRIGESTFGTILSTDSRLMDEGFSMLLTPGDVDTKVVFRCQLVTA